MNIGSGFTQEVLDFEACIVVGDEGVDGEMGIGESHLESVTLFLVSWEIHHFITLVTPVIMFLI